MAHLQIDREITVNQFKPTQPLSGTVLENHSLTPPHRHPYNDVRHLVLEAPQLSYMPGQSIGVVPEGIDPRTSKPHKLRLYSVASASQGDDGAGKTISIVVVRHIWDDATSGRKDIPGVCSKYLCDCEEADVVKITGPAGKRFLLPDDFHQRDLIFLATGTGVAPYRGMLQEMFDQDYQGNGWLFFGVQYADTVLYDNEFKALMNRPNFHYFTALSREPEKNPYPNDVPTRDDKIYVQVRMWEQREQLRQSLAKPNTLIYVCGIKGMEKGIFHVIDHIGKNIGEPTLSQKMRDEGRMLLEVY